MYIKQYQTISIALESILHTRPPQELCVFLPSVEYQIASVNNSFLDQLDNHMTLILSSSANTYDILTSY